jgi:hypothetical protein
MDASLIANAAGTDASTALAADVFDFGEAAQGALVRHVFEVRSAGQRPVRIVSTAIPSFLRVREVPREVAPGGVEPLEVDLPLASFTGAVDAPLHLATDDPTRPRLNYRIKGKVSDEVVLEPRAGLLLRVAGGDAGEAQAELHFRGDAPVEASVAGGDVAGLEITLERIEPGRRYRLRAKLPPGLRAGAQRGVIALRTAHQRVSEVLVPVEVVVLPELIVTPPSVTLTAGAPRGWVRVQSARGLSLGVLDVRSDLAFVSAALVGGAGRAASKRVVVEARPDQAPAADASGELILKIEKPWAGADRVEELRVPVRWRANDK